MPRKNNNQLKTILVVVIIALFVYFIFKNVPNGGEKYRNDFPCPPPQRCYCSVGIRGKKCVEKCCKDSCPNGDREYMRECIASNTK